MARARRLVDAAVARNVTRTDGKRSKAAQCYVRHGICKYRAMVGRARALLPPGAHWDAELPRVDAEPDEAA